MPAFVRGFATRRSQRAHASALPGNTSCEYLVSEGVQSLSHGVLLGGGIQDIVVDLLNSLASHQARCNWYRGTCGFKLVQEHRATRRLVYSESGSFGAVPAASRNKGGSPAILTSHGSP